MKLRLEAAGPDEIRAKSHELLKALREQLVEIDPELAEALEKALPRKEQELKYPALRDLQKITTEEYDRTLTRMLADIARVLAQAPASKSERPAGLVFATDPTDLSKGWLCGVCGAMSPSEPCEHVQAADESLIKALYIGPRGGKWADPEHTIPWDPEKHGRQVGFQFEPAKSEELLAGELQGLSLAEVEERIQGQAIEHAAILQLGRTGVHLVGEKSHVRLPAKLVKWLRDTGAILTHNHPSGGCLSCEDIWVAVTMGLAEMRAVQPGGGVYKIVQPDHGWLGYSGETARQLKDRLEMASWEAYANAVEKMDAFLGNAGGPMDESNPLFSKEKFNEFYQKEFQEAFNKQLVEGNYDWEIEYDAPVSKSAALGGGDAPERDHLGQAPELSEGWIELSEEAGLALWESLEKSSAQPHKYIRRVPYTDSKGRKRYRYYYLKTALARGAREGETIRLGEVTVRVVKVHDNGDISIQEGDQEGRKIQVTERVKAGAWAERLAGHLGPKFYEEAEKRARQAVGAVLRHVPRKLLADLPGDTDAARLAALKERVPEVYDKLQKAFQRAGLNPFEAKQILANSLERRGWEPEARATVIGNVLTLEGARLARRHREVMDAAENLAGGQQVGPEHAQAAVGLAQSNIAQIAKRAESELVRLDKALKAAREDPSDMGKKAAALATALASKAVEQLNALSTAFPGLVDRAVPVARDTMLQVPAADPKPPKREGAVLDVFVAGEGGAPKALKARFVLKEAGEVKPSHNPTTFARNPEYPENLQERAYHRDKEEQRKVIRNASGMKTAFVVNTNVDATNGPPIVMDDGVVLGGNSRTMSMQRLYDDPGMADKAEEMRQYLRDHAYEFGLTPEDVDAMEKPILVREVEVEDKSQQNLQVLVRAMNETFTQAMDPRTMQVAMSRRLPERALKLLADGMQEDETLNEFLGTGRARPFIQALNQAGIIDQRNSNQYMKGSKLNADGKVMVARILAGRVLDDADLLSDTKHSLVESIAKSVPYMILAAGAGKGYDLGETMRVALDAYNRLQELVDDGQIPFKLDKKVTDKELTTITTSYLADMFGNEHPLLTDPRAQAVLEVLIRRSGSRQMPAVFREFAKIAQANPEDQADLLGAGAGRTPDEVFRLAIQAAVDKEAREEAEKEAKKRKKEPQGGLFGKADDQAEPLDNDFTRKVYDRDEVAYGRIKTVLLRMGYVESDFDEGGPFYGWSVNELVEWTRNKRTD